MIDLDKLDKLHEAATPAPWHSDVLGCIWDSDENLLAEISYNRDDISSYIVSVCNAYPEMSAELRSLRKNVQFIWNDNEAYKEVQRLKAENAQLKERIQQLEIYIFTPGCEWLDGKGDT